MTIEGVLETALYVADLDRSGRFYLSLLGLDQPLIADDRMRALPLPGGGVLLLFAIGVSETGDDTEYGHIPGHGATGRQHLCFRVSLDAIAAWPARLRELGIQVEADLAPKPGGRSLYFRDPDGHALELATANIWDP